MTTKWIRVSDKRTGHQYTVAKRAFLREFHTVINSPAVDRNGDPRPPKHKVPLGKAPTEIKSEPEAAREENN